MKKLLYLFFSICFLTNINAQIINFPDANLKARLLLAKNGNGIAYNNGGSFKIDSNNDNEIQVSEALLVNDLVLYDCGISNLSGLEYFKNLTHLNCAKNSISTLDLTPFTNLIGFNAYNNNLTILDVSNLSYLTNFSCDKNQLTSLTVSNLDNLHTITCSENQLTALNLSNLPNLSQLNCSDNQLSNLDLTNQTKLQSLRCSDNNLITLLIKNGSDEPSWNLDFSNNLNLEYICADDFQLTQVQDKITEYGYSNCFVNSYCSYISGENFYNIIGLVNYDELNNGCDAINTVFPNLKLVISNGTNTGSVIGNNTGNYNYAVQKGIHTIQPMLDNPAYFKVLPSSISINFPIEESPYSQNFCITPNGLHPDLDINIYQIDGSYNALPGYANTYKITYKNKGTNTQSGTIDFMFDGAILDYGYANPNVSHQETNKLTWNFSNLKPFEIREILVTFSLNSDQDLPPVFDGDLINFTSSINTTSNDDTPLDNIFTLNQIASSVMLLNNSKNKIDSYFVLYPNPVSNIINIKTKESIIKESIKVYNISGQLVINNDKAKNISSIDVTNLSSGNYIIVIQTDKGVFKKQFIKK